MSCETLSAQDAVSLGERRAIFGASDHFKGAQQLPLSPVSHHLTFTYRLGKIHVWPRISDSIHALLRGTALCFCVMLSHDSEKGVSVDTSSDGLSWVSGAVTVDSCLGPRTPWPTAEVIKVGWFPQTHTAPHTKCGSSVLLCHGNIPP